MPILFTFGINDNNNANVYPDRNGQMRIHVDGLSSVSGGLGFDDTETIYFLAYGPNVKQPPFSIPTKPSIVFNQISDADSHRTALERCMDLCENLQDVPVINHPLSVMNTTRDRVSQLLQDIPGVRMPRTLRCAPESPQDVLDIIEAEHLVFPVIQRITGDHNAQSFVLIKDKSDLDKLHVFPFDGRDFYLTEFVDYKDDNGIYHKQRIVMIDREPFLRHVLFHDHWIVNSDAIEFMREHPDAGNPLELADQIESERLPKADAAIKEIALRLEMDYFGIDCSISESGEVLVFEANANMNILIQPSKGIFNHTVPVIIQRLKVLIRQRSTASMN